jgi:carboxyl-terminal processing protease
MRLARKSLQGLLIVAMGLSASGLGMIQFPSRAFADDIPKVAQISEPPAATKSIVRAVRQLVEEGHILHPKFNDEMSSRAFDMFIKGVDPLKSYFLASDVQEFRQYERALDDLFVKNNVTFAYVVYKRFLTRLDQAMPIINQQIDAAHDFTV